MAKRFSIIHLDHDNEVFVCGHVFPRDFRNFNTVIEYMMTIPETETRPVQIQHCWLLLDGPETYEDISESDLEILLEVFENLVEDDFIFVDEVVDVDLPGIMPVKKPGLLSGLKKLLR